jgi:peptide deformylase
MIRVGNVLGGSGGTFAIFVPFCGRSPFNIEHMIRPIVLWGSGVLEKVSEPVTNVTDTEVKLVQDMIETMYKAPGVGLAAPQVGVSKRIMVTDTTSGERKDQLFTLLNPEIVVVEGAQYEEEGCLSIPGFSATVIRPKKVVLRGLDLNGKEIVIEASDLLARAFCHEIDHLDGKFFLDHLSFVKRDMIKRRIKKLIRQGKWE